MRKKRILCYKTSKKEQAMKSAPWILGNVQIEFGRNGRSLFYFCTGEGIYLLPAEDVDLAVTEDFLKADF